MYSFRTLWKVSGHSIVVVEDFDKYDIREYREFTKLEDKRHIGSFLLQASTLQPIEGPSCTLTEKSCTLVANKAKIAFQSTFLGIQPLVGTGGIFGPFDGK